MEPSFFKYIVPLACTKRLILPPAHHWNKDEEFPNEVILRDKKGNKWPVKLKKVVNQVCFVDGWLKFVKENHVKEKDFILFEPEDVSPPPPPSPNVYSFILLDANTACEKTQGFTTLKSVNNYEEEEDSFEEIEESDEEEDVEKEEDDFDPRRGGGGINNSSSRRRRIGPNDCMHQKRKKKSERNYCSDIYAHEVFKSRGIPRPKNPYFVTCRRGNRNDKLHVPKNVVKDYNLYLQIKTIMRDIEGTEWTTELSEWGDGRRWYHGGWGSFCRKNHVRQGDYCVCEFVEEVGKGLILFVYKLE